jgi:hypothetical protein
MEVKSNLLNEETFSSSQILLIQIWYFLNEKQRMFSKFN